MNPPCVLCGKPERLIYVVGRLYLCARCRRTHLSIEGKTR